MANRKTHPHLPWGQYQAKYKQTRKGKLTEKKYRQSLKGKRGRVRDSKKWRSKNKIKHACHQIAYYAYKNGIIKKQPCVVCGTKRKVEMHHPDYFKPLEVEWRCKKHHSDLNRKPNSFLNLLENQNRKRGDKK